MRPVIAIVAIGIGLLALAAPVVAADPAAYLAEMPTVAQVDETFTGTDANDTAAQRFAALLRLDAMMGKLIGDRDVTGKELPAERALRDSYSNSPGWAGIAADVKARLPTDQRPYASGTGFAAWYVQVDHYRADAAFNRAFRRLFSAAFQKTYASLLAAEEVADAAGPVLPPPGVVVPDRGLVGTFTDFWTTQVLPSLPILIGMLLFTFIAAKLTGGDSGRVVKRKRQLELDKGNPFLLLVAGRRLELTHLTGAVTGVTKTPITNVTGGSSSGYVDHRGDLVVYTTPVTSSTTMHDQFFIKRSDGHQQAVQLRGWDLALTDDHLVSMVWLGNSAVLALNHTTSRWSADWSVLRPYLAINAGNSMAVGCVWGLILVAVSLVVMHVQPLPAVLAVGLGTLLGGIGGPDLSELPDLIPGFVRDSGPRLRRALAEEARTSA